MLRAIARVRSRDLVVEISERPMAQVGSEPPAEAMSRQMRDIPSRSGRAIGPRKDRTAIRTGFAHDNA